MRRLLLAMAVAPLLLGFGPGNCAPDVDFATEAAAEEESAAWNQDDLTLTVPLGVAALLQCSGGCTTLGVASNDPEVVFARATGVEPDVTVSEVGVVVGLRKGLGTIAVGVGDLVYTITVNVTDPPIDRRASPLVTVAFDLPEQDVSP